MSGKPDLSAIPNIPNVVVYVSDDNFAQSYEETQQNVLQNSQQMLQNNTFQDHAQNMGPQSQTQHMASIVPHSVPQPKIFSNKQAPIKTINYSAVQQGTECIPPQREYFTTIASQNGLQHTISNNVNYQNYNIISQVKGYNCDTNESLNAERQTVPVRIDIKMQEECDTRDPYVDTTNFVTIRGVEGPTQSGRCESVRSETAESSCSSLSSVEEGMVIVQNPAPEMVVYDSSVCVRPSGVVLAVGSAGLPQQQTNVSLVGTVPNNQPPPITVPYGWKRIVNGGSVIYISPSNTALSSPDQVKEYLQSAGTCKCGLECPFKYDSVFNFDPKVSSKPWILSPDTTTGDLTKLCNHKRKIITMASLDCKPPDPNMKLRKDINIKRKKRKFGLPCGNSMAMPQIMTQPNKFGQIQPQFNKDAIGNKQVWHQAALNNIHVSSNRIPNFTENKPNDQIIRYHNQDGTEFRTSNGSPMIIGEAMMIQQHSHDSANISHNHIPVSNVQGAHIDILNQQTMGPNRQIANIQGTINPNQVQHEHMMNQIENGAYVHNTTNPGILLQSQPQGAHRVLLNPQASEPNGPGRPAIQMFPFSMHSQQRQPVPCRIQNPQMYNNQYPQLSQYDNVRYVKPYMTTANNQMVNGFKPHVLMNPQNQTTSIVNSLQKIQWQNKLQGNQNNVAISVQNSPQSSHSSSPNVYERVPPLHHSPMTTVWQEEIKKKKSKLEKMEKKRPFNVLECQVTHTPCPNIDVRQIPSENNRAISLEQASHNSQTVCSPSFMEDPSGYLAQQTALLNNTINRQTGAVSGFLTTNSPQNQQHNMIAVSNNLNTEIRLPSNIMVKQPQPNNRATHNMGMLKMPLQHLNDVSHYNQMVQSIADSSVLNEHTHCKECIADNAQLLRFNKKDFNSIPVKLLQNYPGPNTKPNTPNSPNAPDDPVTSSTSSEKQVNMTPPNTLPIQGGTVSTSNISPVERIQSNPSTPNPEVFTQPQSQHSSESSLNQDMNPPSNDSSHSYIEHGQIQHQSVPNVREVTSSMNYPNNIPTSKAIPFHHLLNCNPSSTRTTNFPTYTNGIVTTMASGRTVGSNTITSVLAGRTNTVTVSVNNPTGIPPSGLANSSMCGNTSTIQTQCVTGNINKSPLEMVQSVVSSIQVPHSQHPSLMTSSNLQNSPQIMKHSPTGLPPGHILVSSGGQLIMASTGNGQPNVMPPPPPPPTKVIGSHAGMPPISASSMITNVTGSVTQVIPAVAQQMLGQQTVLVNALPAPFVLQPGMTMTMDGMTVGQNMQIPQIVTGNVIQHQIQIDNSDLRNTSNLLSPEIKKKGKKRKVASQTVANMLQIAAQQNPGVVMSQGFPQQIQMTHSPQGITAGSVMQALTLVPSKTNGPPQIVMNGQPMSNTGHLGTQQLITNSQPTQQINLLQPVNIINGSTGVVPNFPTIQQFIVPNLGGMVMNPDGTATLLQDTSNLGMQLQLQTVNGQNVLTPVQNNAVFNGGQNIIASGPTGMVIRSPTTPQGKIIQHQPHSPGAQFLSPNSGQFVVNGQQFSGQLSPLVANVNAPQQVTFSTSPQQIRPNNSMQQSQQEFIHCGQLGQTLMVPCTPSGTMTSTANQQNTTFVQQNTTIVQQQTTMVSSNQQQLSDFAHNSQPSSSEVGRNSALNVDEKFVISAGDNKQQLQAMILQAENPNASIHRQSVSTQTAVNQNAHVTTNTFCQTTTLSAGSPPDTTTHSPLSSAGEQSPPNADTTTHSGNIDDGLSPTSSNCSGSCDISLQNRPEQSSTMPMVHCISSSEPDSAEFATHCTESDWSKTHMFCSAPKNEYTDITHDKKTFLTHLNFAESSNMVPNLHIISDDAKTMESIGSSRQFEKTSHKRKKTGAIGHHLHSSVMEDEVDGEFKTNVELPSNIDIINRLLANAIFQVIIAVDPC